LATVIDTAAVAVRPAPSVTVRFKVWAPFDVVVVFHEYVADVPLGMLCDDSVVALSSLRTNWVGDPWMLLAVMLTVTVPLTVEPLVGLVIAAPSAGDPPTVTVTVGGLGLLSPRLSSTVSDTV
jgi:hypothetical protein